MFEMRRPNPFRNAPIIPRKSSKTPEKGKKAENSPKTHFFEAEKPFPSLPIVLRLLLFGPLQRGRSVLFEHRADCL